MFSEDNSKKDLSTKMTKTIKEMAEERLNTVVEKHIPSLKSPVGNSIPTLVAAAGQSAPSLAVAMGAEPSGLKFTLTVQGLPPDTFAVTDFSLTESFSSPYLLEVGLVSEDPAVSFESVLDNNATLTVLRDGNPERTVTGIVAAFEQGDTGLHQTRYTLSVRPAMWRTSLRRNSRIFQQLTPETIITTLLRENGVINVAFSLRHAHAAREFCVQYQESDLEFISRLSAEEGMYYYFESGEGGETLIFADDAGTLPSGPELPWNPALEVQNKMPCVSQFRRSVRVRPAMVELKDYTFKNPRWPGSFSEKAGELHNQRPDYEYYDFPGRFKDEQHGKDFARYQLDGLRNDADAGDGESNDARLTPGLLITLFSHPRPDLNTRWQVTSVSHHGRQPQAMKHAAGEQGTDLSTRFSFIPAHLTWRPAPLPKPRVDGSQTGVVVGPPGEEIYCDQFGRVRVQFPWDRYGQSNDQSSCWIRVSQPWAGQGWGVIATPRVGQEVVVDFLHGDPDQPIIIGRTYHASNLPSIGLPAAKTQMAFRSKTHKGEGFNELKFEDANGQEMLSMHAQKDMSTVVKDNQSLTVEKGNRTLAILTGDESKSVAQGSMKEDVKKTRSTTANVIQVQAVPQGAGPGTQLYTATDQIELIVGNGSVVMTKEAVTITFGPSTIVLNSAGIFASGPTIHLNDSK